VAPIAPFGEVLAIDAVAATKSTARCCLCRRTVLPGERYARLVPTGQPAHLFCIGQNTSVRRCSVPVIW
jgi:hypothetical protein